MADSARTPGKKRRRQYILTPYIVLFIKQRTVLIFQIAVRTWLKNHNAEFFALYQLAYPPGAGQNGAAPGNKRIKAKKYGSN